MATKGTNYGIITTDQDLKIKIWNEWLEKASGLKSTDVVGKLITDVIPGLEERKLLIRFNKSLKEGTVEVLSSTFHKYLVPCKIKNANDEVVNMLQHVVIGPLNADSGIIGLVITIEDATSFYNIKLSRSKQEKQNDDIGHIDWRIRKSAGLEFAKNADADALAELLVRIKKEHQDLSILNSILLIMSISEIDVIGALLSLLDGNDIDLKIYVIQILGERNDPQSIPTLMQCMKDADANIRYHAIESLGKLEAREALNEICEIALSGDFFVTFPAIDALTKIGESSIVSKLLPLFDDPIYQDAILNLIGKLGDADLVEFITLRLNQLATDVLPIVSALVSIHERYENQFQEGDLIKDIVNKHISEQGIQNMIRIVESSELLEIKYLVKVLGWISNKNTQKALTRVLGNPALQDEVVEAFVSFGDKVTDILIEHLQSEDDETRKAAAIALGRIGDPNSSQALIEMIGDNDDLTIFVIGSLAKLGVSEAFEPLLKQLGNPNPSIRRATIAALNSIGHSEMPTRIKKLLETGTSLEIESAIQIAGYFGYQNCKDLIKKYIENQDIKIACAAIENLPFFEDESNIDILVRLYTEGSTRVRASVVKAARHIDNKDNVAVLSSSLNDEDPWVRYYAIRSICNLYQKENLFKLMLMAKSDPAIQVRMAAIETIGLMEGTEAVGILSELTNDENTDIVLASIYALGMLETPESLQLLLRFIDDHDPAKKLSAIKAIGRFNNPEVAEKLYLIASREDKNKKFADAAIESLSGILLKQATHYLLKLSEHSYLTQKCIVALLKQKHFALPILNELFKEQSSSIKRNIIEFLSRVKTPEATKALVSLLKNNTVQIRIDTLRALHRIGYQDITEIIEKVSLTDSDVSVRYYAKELLKKK